MKKTILFLALIVAIFTACETPHQPEPPKNNGLTLESRLCGTWQSIYKIPTGVSLDYAQPKEYTFLKIIIDSIDGNIIYSQYYCNKTEELQRQCFMIFSDTTYNKKENISTGFINLCDSINMSFTMIHDTLRLYHTSTNDNELIGGSIYVYKKNNF